MERCSSARIRNRNTLGSTALRDIAEPSTGDRDNRPRNVSQTEEYYEPRHITRYSLADNLAQVRSAPLTMLLLLGIFGFTEILQVVNKGRDFDIDAINHRGNSALHVAVQRLHETTVDCLLSIGASANLVDRSGWTPLCWAVEYRQEEMSERLCEYGANPNYKDESLSTPLLTVTNIEDEMFVPPLLKHGVAPDFCKDKERFTPLRIATNDGNFRIAKLLLVKNANTETRDRTGWTPMLAACKDHLDKIVGALLEH